MTMTETAEITVAELAEWLATQTWSDFATSLAEYHAKKGFLTEKQEAAARKMHAKVTAKAAAPAGAKVTEDGMYRHPDGTVAKVQFAVHGSGNLYAKRLIITTKDGAPKGTFEFEGGLINKLSPEMKMSLEEAAEFGHLYGFCCNCGATLTDEKSIAAGIGPICAGKFA